MAIVHGSKCRIIPRHPIRLLNYKRQFRGIGFFSGTITEQNKPVGGAVIQCIHTATNTHVKTETSRVDGTFTIQGLDEHEEYHLIVIDPNGVWENKVSSKRRPRTTL